MNADCNHSSRSTDSIDFGASLPQFSPNCCGFSKLHACVGILSLTTLLALGTASYFAGKASKLSSVSAPQNALEQAAFQLGGFQLPKIDASAAASSEKFSMATGAVGESGEGLFVLDHNSGLLQCAVLYPRAGQFMGLFTTNVGEALATGGKGGNYLMVTGQLDFPSSSARPAAPLLVYVLDTATGNYACYGVPFNRAKVNAGTPQQGAMVLVATGTANPVADRDSGR